MKTSTLDFPYNARRVYTACKTILYDSGYFRSIKEDARTFRLTASKGLPLLGEDLTINVIATSSSSCKVSMKSSDKLFFNPFKIGNNVRNVKDLEHYIRNEVFRLCEPSQLGINLVKIKLKRSEIKFK